MADQESPPPSDADPKTVLDSQPPAAPAESPPPLPPPPPAPPSRATFIDPAFAPAPAADPAFPLPPPLHPATWTPPSSGPATVLDPDAAPRPATSATLPGPPPPPLPIALGAVGPYRIGDRLGEGGMGVVYRAVDTRLNRTVAIKFMRDGAVASPEDRERFLREPRACAGLAHPGIIQVFDTGDSPNGPWFAMEFIEGETLGALIRRGPVPFRTAATIARKAAEALACAHEHGIIHRDLKPANIMLARGEPKVMDFGLAKSVTEQSRTVSGTIMGTPYYMSPEQALGAVGKIDALSDVYSLGVVLYELLAGCVPFQDPDALAVLVRIRSDEPAPPRRHRRDLPRDLEKVCLKAMAKERPMRYATAADLATDLARYLDGEPVRAVPPSSLYRLRKLVTRNRGTLAAFTAGVCFVSVLLGVWIRAALAERDRRERLLVLRQRAEALSPALAGADSPVEQVRAAQEAIDAALALAPDDPSLRLWRARGRARREDDAQGALAELEALVREQPAAAEARFALAWHQHQRVKNDARARATLAPWDTVAAGSDLATAGSILRAWIDDSASAAIRLAVNRVTRLPVCPEYREMLMALLACIGTDEQDFALLVVRLLDEHLAAHPTDAPAYARRAGANIFLGRDDLAFKDYQAALDAAPQSWTYAESAYGRCMQLKRLVEAGQWLARAEAAGMPPYKSNECRSRLEVERHNWAGAIQWELRSLAAAGSDVDAVDTVCGWVRHCQPGAADLEQVRAVVRRAVLRPNGPAQGLKLVQTYTALGLGDEAHRAAADLEARFPAAGDALRARAELLLEDGKWAAAVDAWTRFLKVNPSDHDAYILRGKAALGLILVKPGSAAAAARDFTEALRIGTSDERPFLYRAGLNFFAGRKDAAVRDLTEYSLRFPLPDLADKMGQALGMDNLAAQVLVQALRANFPLVAAELVRRGDAAIDRDLQLAQRCYGHALYYDGQSVPALLGLARCAARSDPQAAILFLQEAIRCGPVDRQAFARDPKLEPLWGLPKFRELLKK